MTGVRFFVAGNPKTAGSKRAFVIPGKDGAKPRAVVTDDTGTPGKDWRAAIREQAQEALDGRPPMTGALVLSLTFFVKRPKSHYVTGKIERGLKADAPEWPTTIPDLTKMVRAIEDAMKGLVWRDDSQVVVQLNEKRYAIEGRVGATVSVAPMGLDAL